MDIIVETPKGSTIKYAWDKRVRMYRAKKMLAHGLAFPFDFGFIPDTLGEDGDALDVMVVAEFGTYPGAVMDVRIIGCVRVKQSSQPPLIRNDRFLAVPSMSREFAAVKQLSDLPDGLLEQITGFLREYVEAAGKTIKIEGFLDAGEALKLLP